VNVKAEMPQSGPVFIELENGASCVRKQSEMR
jgi:hypothetical protein